MTPFDIYIIHMSWDGGGKNRPVLAFILGDDVVDIYQITKKYSEKSESIRAQYFKIEDWVQAGLDKLSYIDTGTLIELATAAFKGKKPIGKLTEGDKLRLLEFLSSQQFSV
jgi:inosine-uridine nucleoside N-ribohydrolase